VKPTLNSIGRIRTPYKSLDDCPSNIDPAGPVCDLQIDKAFSAGLSGLVPGQQILLLYWFENVNRNELVQHSRKHGKRRGVFALRSPHRPNPIGAAVVTIEDMGEESISVRGLDCLDGTTLLDIKPAILKER
jgi:tRNA-Thr(GGU) m(6)t(6)A37 methyltransferase TsaA